MAINLFLDANILLSFYALSNADISQLTQLKDVVANGDIKLFVSDQIKNEVDRNRKTKIRESFDALQGDTFKCRAPSFVRSIPLFQELQAVLRDANKKHADLIKAVSVLVESHQLDADKILSELMTTAGVATTTSVQFSVAHARFLKGNPPGKKKATIGDELNWEFLLETVPKLEDLHLVSVDSDFASAPGSTKANEFLLREWRLAKSSELHFYRDLNDFFKLHVPKIKLANQAKLSQLISELAGSGSYAATHLMVAKFPEDPDFNDLQVMELINIKENNSQVGDIEGDSDIAAFYGPIKRRYLEIIASESSDKLS